MRICPGDTGMPVTTTGRSELEDVWQASVAARFGRGQRTWIAATGLLALAVGCSRSGQTGAARPSDTMHAAVGDSATLAPRDTTVRKTPIGDPAAVPRPSVTIPRPSIDSAARSRQ